MDNEDKRPAVTPEEADAFRASASSNRSYQRTLLWHRPVLTDAEIPVALGLPPSLWAAIKANGDGPPLFMLGRRIFVKTEDLKAWVDSKAKDGAPGTKRLRAKAKAKAG